MARETSDLTVLDLFCGAGGLSLGFAQAGFQVRLAVDYNDAAVATYAANQAHPVIKADLFAAINLPRPTVIIGGPPCQGFSTAGMRRAGDRRNTLVSRFAEIVAGLRPVAFVFENVEGFFTADNDLDILQKRDALLAQTPTKPVKAGG
jgi:DNA (cytosine-5)-methyltransferase 1